MSPRRPTRSIDPTGQLDESMVLTTWFAADAAVREPEGLLARALTRTVTTRQRRRRRGPASWLPWAGGARAIAPRAAAVVVAMFVGAGVLLSTVLTGAPTTPPVPYLTSVGSIAAGDAHTCAMTLEGQVACWGLNESGQLGDGTTTDRSIPVRVDGLAGVTQIVAGASHTCARVDGGAVLCWGYGSSPGDGATYEDAPRPVEVQRLPAARAIAAGGYRTCAIVDGGRVWCWGSPGQDSQPAVPSELAGVEGVTAIAVGYYAVCGILSDGRVRCRDDEGVVSDVPELAGVTAIAAGQESMSLPHWCAIVAEGHVRCWGGDEYQQLGAGGPAVDSAVPVEAVGIEGATNIAAGGAHSCAVLATGHIRCWGWNRNGELGDPATVEGDVGVPVEVVEVDNAFDVAMGWAHTCAVGADTQVRCWGRGGSRLGDGTVEDVPYNEPRLVIAAAP